MASVLAGDPGRLYSPREGAVDRGTYELKGVAEPWQLFAVVRDAS